MTKLSPDRYHWEVKNEKNKIYVRWLFIVLVFSYFIYFLNRGSWAGDEHFAYLSWTYIVSLVLCYSIANLLVTFFMKMVEKEKWRMHPSVKYLTMTIDLVAVSMVILPTGGEKSIFFLLYLVVVVSNTMRYGIKVGLVSLISLNFLYVGVLIFLHYPELVLPDLQTEILKIAGLWAVGIYIGYLARRFAIIEGEVDKYRQIVRDLLSQQAEQEPPESITEDR